jgi:hypothetical protein
MTTNDKRPRKTGKTPKRIAKIPDAASASEGPATSGTATTVDAVKAPMAARTVRAAKTAPLDQAPHTEPTAASGAHISQADKGGVQAAPASSGGTRRVRSISVSVTSRFHEDRHASIALAAYFRSESRGFAPGHEVEDWLAAEEEVDQRLLGEGRAS